MKACRKCGKDMSRDDGGTVLEGVHVEVQVKTEDRTPEDIAYYRKQLGKYANEEGEANVSICYECYIDHLFGVG